MKLNLDQVKEIEQRIISLDNIYSRARATVLMNATPIIIYAPNVEEEKPIITHKLDEATQRLLDQLSKQHCDELKRLAEEYGIVLKDIEDQNQDVEQEDVPHIDTGNNQQDDIHKFENAVLDMICNTPFDLRETKEEGTIGSENYKLTISSKSTLWLEVLEGTFREVDFEYCLKETGKTKEGKKHE